MTAEEKQLIQRFCSGDMRAYKAFYALYGPRIYRFCHRLCAHAADAEDLTQEVFLAAFQGRQRFQGRSSLTTWLYRIALYQWRNHRAHQDRRVLPLPEEAHSGLTVDPMGTANERMTLDWAMASLPDALRATFVLVKAEGLTCIEAAAVLEIPVGTVKYRIHEATRRLRVLLAGEREPGRAPETSAPGEVAHEV